MDWVGIWIAVVVPVAAALWMLALYNRLVRARNAVRESWAGVDTELKRRYDLIPNLVEVVKGYAAHERSALERVLAARTAAMRPHAGARSAADDENALVGSLRGMIAVAEQYPNLKADRNFLELQRELSNTEDRIQRARRFYNANVRDLNTCVEVFPTNVAAGLFGFSTAEYFEVEDASVRQAPSVSLS